MPSPAITTDLQQTSQISNLVQFSFFRRLFIIIIVSANTVFTRHFCWFLLAYNAHVLYKGRLNCLEPTLYSNSHNSGTRP
ncbi:hypothetical protein Moror_13331 [Moniliophthora roreri MCA 2997]|uniref:Uncharacterized protein n=1 Tax=Moniliophthora roreri (strain MCA 2997) TaxID=1381753 RepID=V2WCR6_MONRO|nr:hypothetical protein Moror_13331 [Moniliophthora roreri MCA 2997]